MANYDDITPPAELVREWMIKHPIIDWAEIATEAARWGYAQAAADLAGQWPEPITDRPPTEADGFAGGFVQYLDNDGFWRRTVWQCAAADRDPWRHCPDWEPPATPEPTLREKALAALDAHVITAEPLDIKLVRHALEQSGEGVA